LKNYIINGDLKMQKSGSLSGLESNSKIDDLKLSESMGDYIEAISLLEDRLKVVRVKNIAKVMKVKMSSVSSALTVLARKGMVNYEKYDYVELTPEGQEVASGIRKRHEILRKFLTDVLGVDTKYAEKDSCRMEHHISRCTINNIIKFIHFINSCPREQKECLVRFKEYLKSENNLP